MKFILVIGLLVLCCYGHPLESEIEEIRDGEVLSDGSILVDDVIMSEDEYKELRARHTGDESIEKRIGVKESSRWPNPGRIPYEFAPVLKGPKEAVLAAFKTYEKYTCLRFVPRTAADKSYIYITGNDYPACTANTGYGKGRHTQIFLNRGCYGVRTILHEIGHALGKHHEHIHPHMETKAKILWQNVDPKQVHRLKSPVTSWPIAYDPESVMHYGPHAFVKAGCKNPDGSRCKSFTMKNGGPDKFGQGGKNGGLSDGDVKNFNYMYKCPNAL